MKIKSLALAAAVMVIGANAHADGFINGGFEAGDTSGWVVGNGSRGGAALAAINPASYLNGNTGRSAIVGSGLDPVLGALMPNVVYSGNNSYRVEDAGITGGLLSVISQTVNNYTDPDIFFAWLAALDNGGHSESASAGMIITLTDLTTSEVIINRRYNAGSGGGGVDARFLAGPGGYFYTPQWQVEQLTIDASRAGHNFNLTVLATDCGPTGHSGYVYVDGFGSVTPPVGVPEPATLALVGAALLGGAAARRRKAG